MNGISVYIHIPYCIAKCPYCDFNSYGVGDSPSKEQMPEARYTAALISELDHYGQQEAWRGKSCETVFFGGGTPSLFAANSIEQILAAIDRNFKLSESAEITLEANPGSIREKLGADKLRAFRKLGVNRISTGAQGFSSDKLQALGRIHSPEDIEMAVENISSAGFDNYNIDLIFGVKGESIESWQKDLERLCSLNPTHASAYCLTIEPGTEFARVEKRGQSPSATEDLQADMYQMTQSILANHGYQQYEISAYAQDNKKCQHNLNYWRGKSYLGIGAGAHGYEADPLDRLKGVRWANIPGPTQYITQMQSANFVPQRVETIDREKSRLEFFFLGLRTSDGISPELYESLFCESFEGRYQSVIDEMKQQKMLIQKEDSICLSTEGFLFSDSVMNAFAAS